MEKFTKWREPPTTAQKFFAKILDFLMQKLTPNIVYWGSDPEDVFKEIVDGEEKLKQFEGNAHVVFASWILVGHSLDNSGMRVGDYFTITVDDFEHRGEFKGSYKIEIEKVDQ